MLVLKRNIGEEIHLSGGIRIVILGNWRIAIEAPETVKILRGELVPADADGDLSPQIKSTKGEV